MTRDPLDEQARDAAAVSPIAVGIAAAIVVTVIIIAIRVLS